MRRLLGVLHRDEDDEHGARAPQPTMAGVGALVERAQEAGLPVELHVEGERRSLPAGLDLAAFRVVQEGLTNALKYADHAPTDVHVRWARARAGARDPRPRPRPRPRAAGRRAAATGSSGCASACGSTAASSRRGGGAAAASAIRAKLPLVADEATVEAAA